MKKILYLLLLLLSFNSFAQELMEYELDKNVTLSIPDNSEEGEANGQTFIKGYIGEEDFVIISKTDKGAAMISSKENGDLTSFYRGVKDGALKASKGALIKEGFIETNKVKVLNFSYSMLIDNQPKVVDTYVFFWKKYTYTLQFISAEKESENYKTIKKKIVDSIKMI